MGCGKSEKCIPVEPKSRAGCDCPTHRNCANVIDPPNSINEFCYAFKSSLIGRADGIAAGGGKPLEWRKGLGLPGASLIRRSIRRIRLSLPAG